MPSIYIQPGDYSAYGLAPSTTAAQVQQASAMIDTYLKRPEGLLYGVDANGSPAYMLNKSPTQQLTTTQAIAPGKAVQVVVQGPVNMIQVGDVFLIDQANPGVCENLQVANVLGNTITFSSVQFAHASGALLAGGLLITEERSMPGDRPMTRMSRFPIANAVSGVGRYGYLRRGDDSTLGLDTFNMLAVFSQFGGPPAWELWTPQANSINALTGEVWVPAGVLLAYYTNIKLVYAAGWTYATLPDAVKQACAQVVYAIQQAPTLGNVKSQEAGGSRLDYFTASALSADVKMQIDTYKARMFF